MALMRLSGNRTVWAIAVLGIVSVLGLVWMQQMATAPPPAPTGVSSPQDRALRGELGKLLGADYRMLPAQDMTGDSLPDYLGYLSLPGASVPSAAGKEWVVREFAVVGLIRRKPLPLVHLSASGILDGGGTHLIPMTGPGTAYRVRVDAGGELPAIAVTCLDAAGNPVSDELSFRWDAQQKGFRPVF